MKTFALALLALAATSAPAAAQVAPAYASYSKSDAILGGRPSALAAILAQQSGTPAVTATSYGQSSTGISPDSRGMTVRPAVMPMTYAPAATDRPDVFGSVALTVARSSLDRRWNKVSRAPVGASSAAYANQLSSLTPLERLDAINRYVNGRVSFVNDIQQYGVSDVWTTAGETLRRGRGDCEDYAIAKLQMLRRAGFAEKDLYLVVLRDLGRRADHAVLVARAEGRLLVLDNGTNRIVDSAMVGDYKPILTFSGTHVWTHGYRRATPPVVVAAVEQPATPTMVQMASSQSAIPPAGLAN